jgi:hypothetical protein
MRSLLTMLVGGLAIGWACGRFVAQGDTDFERKRADRYQEMVEQEQAQIKSDIERMKKDVEELDKATEMLRRCAQ